MIRKAIPIISTTLAVVVALLGVVSFWRDLVWRSRPSVACPLACVTVADGKLRFPIRARPE